MTEVPAIAALYLKTALTVSVDDGWLPIDEWLSDRPGGFHVITAWNPGEDRPDAENNRRADRRLFASLTDAGLDPVRARRSDPDSVHFEDSWIVAGLSDDGAREIGAAFGQVAVFRIERSAETVLASSDGWNVSRPL